MKEFRAEALWVLRGDFRFYGFGAMSFEVPGSKDRNSGGECRAMWGNRI